MPGDKKVIWFVQAAAYTERGDDHQLKLPSWVQSLSEASQQYGSFELAIAFQCDFAAAKNFKIGNIHFYPISLNLGNYFTRWWYKISHKIESKYVEKRYSEIIEDYRPDLIQVFGTEFQFARLVSNKKVPVLLHIQSLVNPYLTKWYSSGISKWQVFRFSRFINLLKGSGSLHAFFRFRKQAKRELEIFEHCKYLTGRTDWDKRITSMMAPRAKYFHCEELLRRQFFENNWQGSQSETFKLVTVINPNLYKGLETILSSARLIKKYTDLNFTVAVIGFSKADDLVNITEKYTGIRSSDVNVSYHRAGSDPELVTQLISSDLYIHCSHIENSSNAICEAMLLGMPVVCTHAGGTESILKNGVEGVIVPPGDPYLLASQVISLSADLARRRTLGAAAKVRARDRHDPQKTMNALTEIYAQILNVN